MNHTIHTKPLDVNKILEEVRANQAKLNGCAGPHDFSVPADRHTKAPITDKAVEVMFCYWICSKCGGNVDGQRKAWYIFGLEDGKNMARKARSEQTKPTAKTETA